MLIYSKLISIFENNLIIILTEINMLLFSNYKIFKKLIPILLFIIIFDVQSQINFYDYFDMKRISTNFNGISHNENSIVVYGEGGVLLNSFDLGKSWKQTNINDSLNIIDMTTYNSNFLGISSTNNLIKSSDSGQNWEIINFDKYSHFKKIFIFKELIYIAYSEGFIILNNKFQIIKEIKTAKLGDYSKGEIFNNFYIFQSENKMFSILNLDTEKFENYSFINLNGCSNCNLKNFVFVENQNKIFMTLDSSLVSFDLTSKLFSPELTLSYIQKSVLTIVNDNLYLLYSTSNKDLHLDSLYFVKYDSVNQKLNTVNIRKNDRYIFNLNFEDICQVNASTLIAIGKDKLIYMSYDAGYTWELKSLLNDLSKFFFFNSSESCIIAPYAQFIYSFNSGTTWLPQTNYDSLYIKSKLFSIPSNDFSVRNFLYNKKGYFYTNNSLTKYIKFPNIISCNIFSHDFETNNHLNQSLNSKADGFCSTPLIIDSVLFWVKLQFAANEYETFILKLDSNFIVSERKILKDTVFYLIYSVNDTLISFGYNSNNPELINIYYSTNRMKTWDILFSFKLDIPTDSRILKSASYVNNNLILNWNYIKLESGQVKVFNKVIAVDLNRRESKEVMNKFNVMVSKFLKIKNRFFSVYSELEIDTLPRKIISLSENFQNDKIFEYSSSRFSPPLFDITESHILPSHGIYKDSLFAFVVYDYLYKSYALYYATLKEGVNFTDEIEVSENSPIYLSKPFPNPTNTSTKFKIFWDPSVDINKIEISGYNLLGAKVAKNSDFNFTQFNNFSGEITWSPQIVSTGVYFIVINTADKSITTSVIIY